MPAPSVRPRTICGYICNCWSGKKEKSLRSPPGPVCAVFTSSGLPCRRPRRPPVPPPMSRRRRQREVTSAAASAIARLARFNFLGFLQKEVERRFSFPRAEEIFVVKKGDRFGQNGSSDHRNDPAEA